MNKIYKSKKILFISLVLVLSILTVTYTSTYFIYLKSVERIKSSLLDLVENQKNLIETLSKRNYSQDSIISILKDAYDKKQSLGQTGEYEIAVKEDDTINFLLSADFRGLIKKKHLVSSNKIKIINLAFAGKTGTYEGKDLRQNNVFAAYTYIKPLNWALVAKIDQSEINTPFYETLTYLTFFIILIIVIGNFIIIKISNPIITELIAKEKELFEEKEQLSITLQSIGDAVITTDNQGNVVFMNKVCEELTGWKNKEAVGKPLAEVFNIINQITRKTCDNPAELVLKSGKIIGLANHTVLIAKDGTERIIADSGSPIRDEKGNIFGVIIVFRDDTEKHRQQEEIKIREEKFRSIFENAADPILLINSNNGYIVEVNTATTKLLGYSKEELQSMSTIDLNSEEYKDLVKDRLKILKENKEYKFETVNVSKDGKEYFCEVHSKIVKEAGQELILSIYRNLTERKKVEEELIKAKELAEESVRLKTSFLANMSHEIRTPLNGILGFSELITTTKRLEDAREMGSIIQSSGKRLLETLNLILDISRIEAGEMKLEFSTFDLIRQVNQAITIFKPTADKKGLYLNLKTKLRSFQMYSAQKAIDSILNNLINNAIKFTNEGGVEVRISEEQNAILKGKTQDLLLIEIEDTGIGIDEKDFENIFLEFRQASEGFSRGYEGTGLGLSLIKRYSDMLGWEISVKSQLGVGSIFSVKIPLNQNPSEKTNKPEMATETEKDKDTNAIGTINNIKFNKDVLVVEDDEISRQLVSVLLRNLCNVDFATNAKEAIETSQKKQYSLVLMDINLGKGENGIYVTQQIKQKENYKNIPFIAMTAFALKGDKEEFLKVGCDDYISKPFDNQLFKDLIEKYLR